MIRLGSLAGYAFEGPRSLAGWTAPAQPGVFAILTKDDAARSQQFSVIYCGHADDLSQIGMPFRHPRSTAWIARAGNKFNLYVCWFDVPGGTRSHREQIARELISIYDPSCNLEKYDTAWKNEWIGEYDTQVTDPLTTTRDPKRPSTS